MQKGGIDMDDKFGLWLPPDVEDQLDALLNSWGSALRASLPESAPTIPSYAEFDGEVTVIKEDLGYEWWHQRFKPFASIQRRVPVSAMLIIDQQRRAL
jgi:hypothetical protein